MVKIRCLGGSRKYQKLKLMATTDVVTVPNVHDLSNVGGILISAQSSTECRFRFGSYREGSLDHVYPQEFTLSCEPGQWSLLELTSVSAPFLVLIPNLGRGRPVDYFHDAAGILFFRSSFTVTMLMSSAQETHPVLPQYMSKPCLDIHLLDTPFVRNVLEFVVDLVNQLSAHAYSEEWDATLPEVYVTPVQKGTKAKPPKTK
ncbi:hypothetical protein EDD18DRAFT_1329585 [Armillaria luteobubalina]|uniref:Uncharacterized protein n=1 Tax=Armillaria luteobubalina TaxID=153913 RepID=A0AA39QAH1_9AGAR|nr:hypothetical protein EDD18DRAFT_1329585 [Armillaria luteobubalina]